ncbi:MAG: serine/threonine protein kinase [Frankiaceae bacterium]|nr:serine/threonine protein kinase [Frankiaceae bacterium]
MTEVWAFPGYDVQALIGFGATGEVWRARELSTGDLVALKRLRDGCDLTAIAALRREASVLRSLDTPYVVRLRALLGEGADTVLVLDLAAGGSLAALLARRGSLDPGEVVTIAAPLAQALAAAHACGLVHGDVTPSNVLFGAQGMPLLADLGLARFAGVPVGGVDGTAEYVDPAVAAGGDPDAASDVWALAAVCHHMLSGSAPHDGESADEVLAAARSGARAPLGLLAASAPRPLVAAIEEALQADPTRRPDAAAFARAIRRSHAAAPVRLTGGLAAAGPRADVRPTHEVRPATTPAAAEDVGGDGRRRLVVAGVAAVVLVLAGGIGWASGRSAAVPLASVAAASPGAAGQPGTPPATPPAGQAAAQPPAPPAAPRVPEPDWRTVLDGLDRARSIAFAGADASGLLGVYGPGSPLLAADRAAIAALAASGRQARGVRHAIRAVTVSAYDGQTATLRAVDVLAAYTVVDGSGRVVQRTAPRSAATFVVTVVRTPGGWRLQQVRPA